MITAIVWGIGKEYCQHVNVVKYFEMLKQLKVVGLTDRSLTDSGGTIDGYELFSINDAIKLKFDVIIVMSEKQFGDIFQNIKHLEINTTKVIPCRVLDIPGINLDEYYVLKIRGISIVSNNCWGGLVYRTLGMECQSPFKNLFLEDEDYLKLVSNLRDYLSYSPEIAYEAVDNIREIKYPVLKLKDVYIHCNHADSFDEAILDWKRRCEKMDWDHLFYEMYSDNVKTFERFAEICQDSVYIGFTDKQCRSSIRNIETLTVPENGKLWKEVLDTASAAGRFNLVDLLMHGLIRERGRD